MTNNPTIDGVSRELLERVTKDDIGLSAKKAHWLAVAELRALLDAPAVEKTNELREHCKQCAEVVKTWPEWKRDCLGGVPAVERQKSVSRFWCHEATNIRCVRESDYDTLQSTIARLEARVAELESGRGEVVYQVSDDVNGWRDVDRLKFTACQLDPEEYECRMLFTAPPASIAVTPTLWEICVRDEPSNPESPCEYVYVSSASERDSLLRRGGATVFAEYACLDATAVLNGPAK